MNMEKEIMDLKSTENMHKDDLREKNENENIFKDQTSKSKLTNEYRKYWHESEHGTREHGEHEYG